MKRTVSLTDDLIRQALAPRRGGAVPEGLLEAIAVGVRGSPQRRGVFRRVGAAGAAAGWGGVDRRLVWVLAAAALMLAIAAGALIGGRMLQSRDPSSIDLVPTGIDTLTPDGDGYSRVVVDGRGMSWAIGRGHVTRFDPRTGVHRTWTVSDDAAFATAGVTPMPAGNVSAARAGGVWLADGDRIQRFDGSAFRSPIPAPGGGAAVDLLVESAAGTLWAADGTGDLRRWDGTVWQPAPAGRTTTPIWSLVVLADDDVWVADAGPYGADVLWHLSGARWERVSGYGVPALGARYVMAAGPDGRLWVGSSRGVARYRAGAWESMPDPGIAVTELAAGDGTMWALAGDPVAVARFTNGGWTKVPVDGAAGDVLAVSAVGSDVYLGTTGGLYRHDGSGWTRAWAEDARMPTLAGAFASRNIAAVSADEAWVGGEDGVWHFADGRWSGPDVPPNLGAGVRRLALGPGGELVVATDAGISVRRDGRWTTTPFAYPGELAVANDGSVWFGAGGAQGLVHLEMTTSGSHATTITCPVGGYVVTIASDGAIWTGGIAYSGAWGLARYDGRTCSAIPGLEDRDVVALAATGTSVVAVAQKGTGPADWAQSVIRVDATGASTVEATYPGIPIYDIAVGPSGDVWYDTPDGLGRSLGGTWRGVGAGGIHTAGDISIAPDGTAWFFGPSGIQRLRPAVAVR